MIEFVRKQNFDLDGNRQPETMLVVKTDDSALITAITETVRKFADVRKVLEEATLPAEDVPRLLATELNLFAELPEENKVKVTRNTARRHVEVVFDEFPQSIAFRTLGELYKWMTGKDTARAGKPETHIHTLNKKRLPNRPTITDIIRMDRAGRSYQPTRKAN